MQTLKYIRTNFPNTSNLFLSPAFFLSKYSIAPNTYKAFGICLLRSPVLLGVNERINTKLPRNLAGNRTLMESQLSIRWNECSEAARITRKQAGTSCAAIRITEGRGTVSMLLFFFFFLFFLSFFINFPRSIRSSRRSIILHRLEVTSPLPSTITETTTTTSSYNNDNKNIQNGIPLKISKPGFRNRTIVCLLLLLFYN